MFSRVFYDINSPPKGDFKDQNNMANKLFTYIKESRDELKKVVWPSRKETIKYTLIVIGISLVVAVFLGLADYLLTIGLEKIIAK